MFLGQCVLTGTPSSANGTGTGRKAKKKTKKFLSHGSALTDPVLFFSSSGDAPPSSLFCIISFHFFFCTVGRPRETWTHSLLPFRAAGSLVKTERDTHMSSREAGKEAKTILTSPVGENKTSVQGGGRRKEEEDGNFLLCFSLSDFFNLHNWTSDGALVVRALLST